MNEPEALKMLLYRFSRLVIGMGDEDFVHGDFRSDNVLFRRYGPLVLVDYDTLCFKDTMYSSVYPRHLDEPNMVAIAFSLYLLTLRPELWNDFYNPADGLLLFTKDNLENGHECALLEYARTYSGKAPLMDLFLKTFENVRFWKKISDRTVFQAIHQHDYVDEDTYLDYSRFQDERGGNRDVSFPWRDGYMVYSYDRLSFLCDAGFRLDEYAVRDGTLKLCDNAFEETTTVKRLTLPASLRYIGCNVFSSSSIETIVCDSACFTVEKGGVFNRDKTELISVFTKEDTFIVPTSVKTIRDAAFAGNRWVKSVVIPEGITILGDKTFYCCTSLEKIVLPETLVRLGEKAFCGTRRLRALRLPAALKEVGEACFAVTGLRELTLPEGIERIPDYCFAMSTLVSYAVYGFFEKYYPEEYDFKLDPFGLLENSIRIIKLPSTVKHIGNVAFGKCVNLRTLELPEHLQSVGYSLFMDCENLNEIHYKGRVFSAHEEYEVLKELNPEEESEELPEKSRSEDGTTLFRCRSKDKDVIITSPVKFIGPEAFAGLPLERVVLPDTLRCIGREAFRDCTSLKEIVIPEGTLTIGYKAFSGCTSLTRVQTPSTLLRLGEKAFCDCPALNDVTLKGKIKYIGYGTFEHCLSLRKLVLPYMVRDMSLSAYPWHPGGPVMELWMPVPHIIHQRYLSRPLDSEELASYSFSDSLHLTKYKIVVYTEDRKKLFSDEDTMFEMDRLPKDYTGLDYVVLVQTLMEGRRHLEPAPLLRIEVDELLVPVVVAPVPHLVTGGREVLDALSITSGEWRKICSWIRLNREALTDYWNGHVSTTVFLNHLVKI